MTEIYVRFAALAGASDPFTLSRNGFFLLAEQCGIVEEVRINAVQSGQLCQH